MGWNISLQPIENPDEPRYACAAREMVRSNRASDWIVPVFNGAPRLQKPILIYWVLAGAGRVGEALGLDLQTSFRLVPLGAGWLAILATYLLGRKLWSPRAGLLSGLLLLTTFYFHETTREILIDPLLTALLAWAWYFFACAIQRIEGSRARPPWGPLAGFYLCLGLACLAKGPALVAIFAVAPMAAYLVWERKRFLRCAPAASREDAGAPGGSGRASPRRLALLHRTGLWWGLPMALGLGFSWGYLLWDTGHGEATKTILWREIFQRALGQVDHNDGIRAFPFLFYLLDLPGRFLPWALFFPLAIGWSWQARRGLSTNGKLLLCAILIPSVLMGLVGSKRSLYFLPLYPFLCLWLARAWDGCLDTQAPRPRGVRYGMLILAGIGVVCALGAVAFLALQLLGWNGRVAPCSAAETVTAGALALGLCAGAWLTLRDLYQARGQHLGGDRPLWQASLQVLLMTAVAGLAYESVVRPGILRREDHPGFYASIRDAVGGRPLVWLGGKCSEAVWYLEQEVPNARRLENLGALFFSKKDSLLLVRGREFRREEVLRTAVRELKQFEYKGERYHLVEPDPARVPASLFFQGSAASAPGDAD